MKRILSFLKFFMPFFLVMLFGVILVVGNVFLTKRYDAKINEESDILQELNVSISQKRMQQRNVSDNISVKASVLDLNRVSRDDELVKSFLSDVFNWTNLAEYKVVRNNFILDRYDDRNFLIVFFPEIPLSVDRNVFGYKTVDPFERIQHLEVKDLNSNVTGVSGSAYTYFSEVVVSVLKTDGSYYDDVHCVFVYTVNESGVLSDLAGYVVD